MRAISKLSTTDTTTRPTTNNANLETEAHAMLRDMATLLLLTQRVAREIYAEAPGLQPRTLPLVGAVS